MVIRVVTSFITVPDCSDFLTLIRVFFSSDRLRSSQRGQGASASASSALKISSGSNTTLGFVLLTAVYLLAVPARSIIGTDQVKAERKTLGNIDPR